MKEREWKDFVSIRVLNWHLYQLAHCLTSLTLKANYFTKDTVQISQILCQKFSFKVNIWKAETRALEIPCSKTVRNFNLLVLVQGLYSSSLEEYPDYEIDSFFLFLEENTCCGYSLEVPHWGASNKYHWGPPTEYPQHIFSLRNIKNNFKASKSKSWLDRWVVIIYLSMDKYKNEVF